MPHTGSTLTRRFRTDAWTIGNALAVLLLVGNLATSAEAQTVRYRVVIDNTWSNETHPGAFPGVNNDPHFSWFGGGTHNDQVSFWQVGEPTSPGMTQMAEDGRTFALETEFNAAINTGNAGSFFPWRSWVCPDGVFHGSCGTDTREFEIHEDFPLVTLVSMLGPSPDWFVGVTGLSLRENGEWLSQVVVDLHPYDGGTRSRNVWALFGPENEPPEPLELITEETGQLVGPGKMGTFTFTLLTVPPVRFLRGDCNDDGNVNLADAVCILNWLFAGEATPGCIAALNTNGDDDVNITDAVSLLSFLFAGGPPPVDPFPDCGPGALAADEELGCENPPNCQ